MCGESMRGRVLDEQSKSGVLFVDTAQFLLDLNGVAATKTAAPTFDIPMNSSLTDQVIATSTCALSSRFMIVTHTVDTVRHPRVQLLDVIIRTLPTRSSQLATTSLNPDCLYVFSSSDWVRVRGAQNVVK